MQSIGKTPVNFYAGTCWQNGFCAASEGNTGNVMKTGQGEAEMRIASGARSDGLRHGLRSCEQVILCSQGWI